MPLERLGPYRITRLLGRGGMGAVYEGVHETTGAHTAIKILSFAFADDSAFRTRFEAEIEMLKQLRHPNIVQLIGYGEQDGVLFYSMELVPGENLHELLARGTRFTWREAVDIAVQVCSALKHAHDHGVIHRDLKPANLLRTPDGQVKLTDFGIAKFFGATQLTSAGGIIGTADYMSPEQAEGQGVTARSDLYSLGAVLYTLLTGKPPFSGRTVTEVIDRMRRGDPAPIRRQVPSVPEPFEEIIQQLLSRDPQQRIATPLALSKRLRAMLHGLATSAEEDDIEEEYASPDAVTRVLEPDQPTPAGNPATQQVTNPTPPARADEWDENTIVTSSPRRSDPPAESTSTAGEAPPTHYVEVESARRRAEPTPLGESDTDSPWRQRLSIAALALALLAVIATAIYLARPPDADTLYQRIETLAAEQPTERLDGQVRGAIDEFLRRFPNDQRAAEIERLKADHNAHWLWRRLEREARRKGGAEYLEPLKQRYVEAMRNAESDPAKALQQLNQIPQHDASSEEEREILEAARHMQQRLEAS